MGCQSSTISSESTKEKITIGYWALPLLAQPLRYLLELTQIPYQENLYFSDNNQWTNQDKHKLGLDYPNLPYLIQGDFKITESQNLVNYVIDISGQTTLQGKGNDKYTVDNIRLVCHDLILSVHKASVKPVEERKLAFEKDSYQKIKQLQKQLNEKTQFFSQFTVADIYFYTFASYFKSVLPDFYREFRLSFEPFLAQFESISQIRTYQQSDNFKKIFPSFIPTKKISQEKITLGYWPLPVQAQPIRYILELGEIKYNEKLYSGNDWFENDKKNLGLDYPNLPYLIQGELKITESYNIMNYVVEETNQQSLLGNKSQKYEVNNAALVIKDLIVEVYKAKDLDLTKQREYFDKNILPKFSLVIKQLGEKKQFFLNLTIADIFLYTLLKNLKMWIPHIYKQYEFEMSDFMNNFETIPQIARYHKSERYSQLIQQKSS